MRLEKIDAFVLAGGKSSRMGQDKGLLSFNGKPMITYVLEALEKNFVPVKIIANNPEYRKFGFEVFGDVVSEKGPMGGLCTAYCHTEAAVVLLLSCDMPFINSGAIRLLLKELDEHTITAARINGKIHPLFASYPKNLKKKAEAGVASGSLKMTDFILDNPYKLLSSQNLKPWWFDNINDLQELKEAERNWNDVE